MATQTKRARTAPRANARMLRGDGFNAALVEAPNWWIITTRPWRGVPAAIITGRIHRNCIKGELDDYNALFVAARDTAATIMAGRRAA